MIKLKKLELQGFRKFKSQTSVEFPDRGLMLIEGDSGAGKSTIMQAVAYALDICPFPATTIKSWSGESLQVVLTLDADGSEVKIFRGKKTAFEKDGVSHTGAKALEEGLRNLFGMAPSLLSALTYRPQDTLGLFLSKDDTEKKEFLGEILGLNSIEKALEDADSRRKKLSSDFTFAQGVLAEREAALRKILEQMQEISPDPYDPDLKVRVEATALVLSALEKQAEALDRDLAAAHQVFLNDAEVQKLALGEKLETAKKLYTKLKSQNDKTKQDLEARRNELRSQINRVSQELSAFPSLKKEKQDLEAHVAALKQNKCYVCHQTFTAEAAIDEKLERIAYLSEKIATEAMLQVRFNELSSKLKELVPFEDPNEAKLLKISSGLESEIRLLGKNITDTRVLKIQEARESKLREIVKAKGDKLNAESALREHLSVIETKDRLRVRQEETKNASARLVDEKRAELATIEGELNAERDFIAALGKDGFLGVIFDEVLREISDEANRVLKQLANTAHVSVSFRTENAKGKRAIVPVFFVDGYEATRQSGLSGGMGASADLAVDLGVATVVERRLGRTPGWFFLDETFNGMPHHVKEAALEILEKFSVDRLVMVIDHGTEMKESFQKVLTVTTENGTSIVSERSNR